MRFSRSFFGAFEKLGKLGLLSVLALVLHSQPGFAGNIVITNQSGAEISCTADGYTTSTGWPFDWQFQIASGKTFQIGPSETVPNGTMNWVNCEGLQTRQMNVTATGPNAYIFYTGAQTRVLNVALYPYLPSNPDGNFDQMMQHVIQQYQAANPDVMLNSVLNGDINIYSYTGLSQLLGAGGFDVMELDTLYMTYIASNDLVVPVTVDAGDFWPAGVANVTHNGQTYGVPSWLCSNFLFAFDSSIQNLDSLSAMLSYMNALTTNRPKLAGVFLGSWGLTSDYLFSYAQQFGFANVGDALTAPINSTVINNINSITNECAFGGDNKCITQSGYKALPDGQVARLLAEGQTSTYMGFSEQSFYVQLYGGNVDNLYLTPMLWGAAQSPMLYTDAFVTSKANCSADPCLSDAAAFSSMMVSNDMRNYIAFSQDLPAGSPPRHLAVATQAFYQQPQVQADHIYSQLAPIVAAANAFPNYVDATGQVYIHQGACQALKALNPAYECKLAEGESRNPAFNRASASARAQFLHELAVTRSMSK